MLYIHIPFCKQKCSYCNFHFSTSLKYKNQLLEAIAKELELRQHEIVDKNLKTLYFGGGTPSILSIDEIKNLLDTVSQYYHFSKDIEITLEANPDDLDSNFLKQLAKTDINRLSIGTQSFDEKDLLLMNRAHSSKEAEDSIKKAQDFGFQNINIDLIYGSSSLEIWKSNLDKAIQLRVPHISSYALTVEPKTALEKWIRAKKVKRPEEDLQNEQFYYMVDFLKNNGFEHYEISNFAKKTFESKHNSAYWKGQPYLGIGPSAHSYNGKDTRSWNVNNNILYMKGIFEGSRKYEEELLTIKDHLNELVMIGLRTKIGVNIKQLKALFSNNIMTLFYNALNQKTQEGLIIREGDYLKIPEKHWFLADGIISDLFLI